MEIALKKGIAGLVFGMQTKDVESILGNPDCQYRDEDDNRIYLYFSLKLRLTFYADEAFRLGYAITSNRQASLFGLQLIGQPIATILDAIPLKNWETEDFDSVTNYFNETNWLTLQSEYGEVIRIEIGALIDEVSDTFIWGF